MSWGLNARCLRENGETTHLLTRIAEAEAKRQSGTALTGVRVVGVKKMSRCSLLQLEDADTSVQVPRDGCEAKGGVGRGGGGIRVIWYEAVDCRVWLRVGVSKA